ncbi:MAG: 4-hydroxy-3-methylbut-2-enyl diphosphate reductase [Desulfobacterales bacterium]|jgi:4-hydroxy-3-methylbut-2-enyl diphosphate reductase|nr:4-hydroxy-3-methylbut-2-enyl diphosphate reductase [Desulfobacterales bacterium]
MKIVIAKMSGFCMGVRRAVEMVLDAPGRHPGPICTYGPLIHNPQVLELLASKDIATIKDIPECGAGTVLIRAHGVPPETKKRLKTAGYKVIDATCPRVIRVQSIIRKHARQNHAVIIVGDKDHPEVVGLLGYAGADGYVVAGVEEIKRLPAFENAIIVAQTTQNTRLYAAVREWARHNYPHYKVFETICDSTERRQSEVQRLAESVDAVVVVGGRESGNTQRLFEIARRTGKPAFHVENETDLSRIDLDALRSVQTIGITAGASTPNWVIRKVYMTLETMVFKRKSGWHKAVYTFLRAALLSNFYVSLGAAGLCYAATRLQEISDFTPFVLIAFLYVQSMHILNHLTGSKADRFNEPDRARFYEDRKVSLTVIALTSGAAGLVIAYLQGWLPFLTLLVISLLGLSYRLTLIPKAFAPVVYRRIKDIPGSKTILIALAWGVVTSVLPPISASGSFRPTDAFIFVWSSALVFVRTAFFDILDMQGDRLVGKETIPTLLGERRSLRLLKGLSAALVVGLPVLSALTPASSLAVTLALCPAVMSAVILAFERGLILPGVRLEFLVESHLVLAGALALGWGLTGI